MLFSKISWDRRYFLAGLLLLLLIRFCLPEARDERSTPEDNAEPSELIAELVGYSLAQASALETFSFGSDKGVDLRLHSAPLPGRAAVMCRSEATGRWMAMPGEAGDTLRVLSAEPVRSTSLRPFGADIDTDHGKPEVLKVPCSNARWTITPTELAQLRARPPLDENSSVLWAPTNFYGAMDLSTGPVSVLACGASDELHWSSSAPGSHASDPSCDRLSGDWKEIPSCLLSRQGVCRTLSTRSGAWVESGGNSKTLLSSVDADLAVGDGVWLKPAQRLESFRLGLDASYWNSADGGGVDCSNSGSVEICSEQGVVASLTPLEIEDGDVLGVGRTRFLVKETPAGRLLLLHVRHPDRNRGRSYFQASSSADLYHPNSRSLWSIPTCDAAAVNHLHLRLSSETSDTPKAGSHGQVVTQDRLQYLEIENARDQVGRPLELPIVEAGASDATEVSLCASSRDGQITARVSAPVGVPLAMAKGSVEELDQVAFSQDGGDAIELALGARNDPQEAVFVLGGNVIRVAPAAGQRVTFDLRNLLFLFCFLQFVGLSWLLSQARSVHRAQLLVDHGRRESLAWPPQLGPASLLQLASLAILAAMYIGADYQLALAVDPDLAGKPDYFQAILEGMTWVALVLAVAAGVCAGSSIGARWVYSLLAGAYSLFITWAVWYLESHSSPKGLWLSELRNSVLPAYSDEVFGDLLLLLVLGALAVALFSVVVLSVLSSRRRNKGTSKSIDELLVGWFERTVNAMTLFRGGVAFALVLAASLALGLAGIPALLAELLLLGAVAWVMAYHWSLSRKAEESGHASWKSGVQNWSIAAGFLTLAMMNLFFWIGSDLHDTLSFIIVVLPLVAGGFWLLCLLLPEGRPAWKKRISGSIADTKTATIVVLLWSAASAVGVGVAVLLLDDMGSVAAWLPALLAGVFWWAVRPDDARNSRQALARSKFHFWLIFCGGLLLLGAIDVLGWLVSNVPAEDLERPRQRFDLATSVAYLSPGEWITQVRWLAANRGEAPLWVPNMNSDVAIFGLAALQGRVFAVLASALLFGAAFCAAIGGDQAMREATWLEKRYKSRLYAMLFRCVGLFLSMVGVFLICQWLVHLSTGVVLRLPITGLVFPWVSHGNTAHLAFTGAIALGLAGLSVLNSFPSRRQERVP